MDIDRVISRCPFLHNIATTQGHAFASSIACNPLIPASHDGPRRPLLEETQDLSATFRLFHGPQGVLPLASSSLITPTPCTYDFSTNAPSAVLSADNSALGIPRRHELSKGPSPFASAPLAAMSLGMVGET